jgi:two-component system sensor histidine kinase AlgZ
VTLHGWQGWDGASGATAISSKGYLSIEQYRLGNRLQLDCRARAIAHAVTISQRAWQSNFKTAFVQTATPCKEGGAARVDADYKEEGGFVLMNRIPCDAVAHPSALSGFGQARANFAARPAALFGLRTSLSVDRRDGRHFTCLRYPCARLTQESSAI